MTATIQKAVCPRCGSDAIIYEWKVIISETVLGFNGNTVVLDEKKTNDIAAEDHEAWYACVGCGHEDTEPSTFKNDAA